MEKFSLYLLITLIFQFFCFDFSFCQDSKKVGDLKIEAFKQDWQAVPAGTDVKINGKDFKIKEDLAYIQFFLKFENFGTKNFILSKPVLLNKKGNILPPPNSSVVFIKDKNNPNKNSETVSPGETKVIHLQSMANVLKNLLVNEPLFVSDSERTFKIKLIPIPEKSNFLKK